MTLEAAMRCIIRAQQQQCQQSQQSTAAAVIVTIATICSDRKKAEAMKFVFENLKVSLYIILKLKIFLKRSCLLKYFCIKVCLYRSIIILYSEVM